MASIEEILENTKERMGKSVDSLQRDLGGIRTGRASTSLVENINVEYYGTQTPLSQLSSISVPEARTIVIQPWDKSVVGDIEQALLSSKIGITPLVAGEVIRLPIPELSGERREELCKSAQTIAEHGRVGVRGARKEALDNLKAAQKDGLSEDDFKRAEKDVQEETDAHVGRINDSLASKESELRQV